MTNVNRKIIEPAVSFVDCPAEALGPNWQISSNPTFQPKKENHKVQTTTGKCLVVHFLLPSTHTFSILQFYWQQGYKYES